MQKWEYRVIAGVDHTKLGLINRDPCYIQLTTEGEKILMGSRDFKTQGGGNETKAMAQLIAQLGEEGWELVGVASKDRSHSLYFKRPKQD